MRITTWITGIGCVLLLGACSGGNDATPVAGGGGGGGTGIGSADAFTQTVAQAAGAKNEDQEPSVELAHTAATTPENTEPANL